MVLGRAIVRDIYDREGSTRALATIMMAMSLAPSISPAIGAYLTQWIGWRANFVLLGVVGAAVLLVAIATLEETHSRSASVNFSGMAKSFVVLARSPAFLALAFATAFTSASWFTFLASAPYLLAEVLHEPPSTYGLMILMPMAAYILGNAGVTRLSVVLGSTRLFILGLALSLTSGVMLAVWCAVGLTPWALFVPMAVSSIGNGLRHRRGAQRLPPYRRRRLRSARVLADDYRGRRRPMVGQLPQGTAIPMVAVVGASLALALVFGVFASFASSEDWPSPDTAPLRAEIAGGQ